MASQRVFLPLSGPSNLTPKQQLYVFYPEVAPEIDRIISCESSWRVDAKNPNSTATGLSQFLVGTWTWTRNRMGKDPDPSRRLVVRDILETTVYLFDGGRGASHWAASACCHGLGECSR